MRPFMGDDVEASGEKGEETAVAVAEHKKSVAAVERVVDIRADDIGRLAIRLGARQRVHDAVDFDVAVVHPVTPNRL